MLEGYTGSAEGFRMPYDTTTGEGFEEYLASIDERLRAFRENAEEEDTRPLSELLRHPYDITSQAEFDAFFERVEREADELLGEDTGSP